MIPAPTPKARLALLLSVTLGLPVAALAQDDTPARSPADTALLSTIVGMDFGKQSAVYDRLGFDPGPEFWNCVCRAAAYGSSSASQVSRSRPRSSCRTCGRSLLGTCRDLLEIGG